MAQLASAQTVKKLDTSSLSDLLHTTGGMVESFITAASLPSPHDTTIGASPPSGRSLSSSPIWKRRYFEWAITFYTIKYHTGYISAHFL
jgi:hypothetical protein